MTTTAKLLNDCPFLAGRLTEEAIRYIALSIDKNFVPNVSPEELGGLLFGIHDHAANLCVPEGECEDHVKNPDEIIYHESDVIELLKTLGFPEPVWGESLTFEQFKAKQNAKTTTDNPGTSNDVQKMAEEPLVQKEDDTFVRWYIPRKPKPPKPAKLKGEAFT